MELSKVVNVLVGAGHSKFVVHKDLLTSKSEFFRAALTGDWEESKSQEVQLPEDDPAAFEMFAHWLYFTELNFGKNDGAFISLSKAWLLGDKLQAIAFKIAVINELVSSLDKIRIQMNGKTINNIYSRTLPGAPLRRLMVDVFIWEGKIGVFGALHGKGSEDLDIEFAVEVADRFMTLWQNDKKMSKTTEPYKLNICAYHEHSNAEARCGKT